MSEVQAVMSSLVIETFQMLTLFFTICGRLVCGCGCEGATKHFHVAIPIFFFFFDLLGECLKLSVGNRTRVLYNMSSALPLSY